ncbi:MAG: hypothetical protein PUE71_09685 [Clostridia bacterium]|nr:hypothetical protein [Clostridia bacterium]
MKKKFDFLNNMSFEISDRDKKLLMVLLAVVIVIAAYMLGYQKFAEKTLLYQNESAKLHTVQKDLIEKTQNRAKYEADTAEFKKIYNSVFANYSSSINQDDSLEFLNKVEKITGAWIKGVTFSEATNIYTFGQVRSSNPSANGTSVYKSDYKGYKTTLTISYEAEYSQWKQMINYINNYFSKNAIESMSMSYNVEDGTVTGTISIATYAVVGGDRKHVSPSFALPVGTDNIFNSSVFDSTRIDMSDTTGDYILSNYDYYILLNSANADVDSCIIGKKNDMSRNSVLTANSNGQLDVSVRFFGTAGAYKVQYKIGDKTYPLTDYNAGVAFEPGNTLDMLIMSSPRIDSSDTGNINLSVTNDTDMPLNIKICNDDTKSSRVKITNRTGDITIYQ